jgi:hypothetical protein
VTEFRRNDPRHKTGAIVEIVEIFRPAPPYQAEEVPVIKVSLVYVNGTPVGLLDADAGVELDIDPKAIDATKLTLTLMPRQIIVRAVDESPEETVFDGPIDLGETEFRSIEQAEATDA